MSINSILFAFVFIILIASVNASIIQSDNIQVLKSNKIGQIMIVCENNEQKCSSTTVGNISIFYPNSSIFINNKNLTYDINYFYYPLEANQTSVTGKYVAVGFFNDGGTIAPFAFDFYITNTGTLQSTSQGINSIAYLILMIALTLIFGFLSFKLSESETLWILALFFFVMALSLLVYDVFLAYEYKVNYLNESGEMNNTIFIILLTILTAGFISGLVMLLTKWKNIIKFVKSAIKEEKDDDGWDNNNFDSFKR